MKYRNFTLWSKVRCTSSKSLYFNRVGYVRSYSAHIDARTIVFLPTNDSYLQPGVATIATKYLIEVY